MSHKPNKIQVTYITPRKLAPLPLPPQEPPKSPQMKEDHQLEKELLDSIEEERAKYAEAKKTISLLVTKV